MQYTNHQLLRLISNAGDQAVAAISDFHDVRDFSGTGRIHRGALQCQHDISVYICFQTALSENSFLHRTASQQVAQQEIRQLLLLIVKLFIRSQKGGIQNLQLRHFCRCRLVAVLTDQQLQGSVIDIHRQGK